MLVKKVYRKIKKKFRAARHICITKWLELSKPRYGLCREGREQQVIVSMSSHKARFSVLHISLKAILRQTVKPDKIVLNIDKEDEAFIPKKVLDLQAFGVEIKARDEHIKPHTKYFYTFQENPDALVITVDDDIVYPKTMVESLLASYKKHPDCVHALRVHLIAKNESGNLKNYADWHINYTELPNEPSFALLATGVGGVLYPSSTEIFDSEVFNLENIKRLALTADDIWLKFMELRCDVKCVSVPCKTWGFEIRALRGTGLKIENFKEGSRNDACIQGLEKEYNIKLADFAVTV